MPAVIRHEARGWGVHPEQFVSPSQCMYRDTQDKQVLNVRPKVKSGAPLHQTWMLLTRTANSGNGDIVL